MREGNPRQVIGELAISLGNPDAALSVVTVIELAHGIERADSASRRDRRQRFLDELLLEFRVEPVTIPLPYAQAVWMPYCSRVASVLR